MEIVDRIFEFMESQSIQQIDFCKKTNIPTSTLSNYKKRNSTPSGQNLAKIKEAYPRLSIDWLLLGEGDMLLPAGAAPAALQNMTVVNGNGNTQVYNPAECAEKLRERDLEIAALKGQVNLLKELLNSK